MADEADSTEPGRDTEREHAPSTRRRWVWVFLAMVVGAAAVGTVGLLKYGERIFDGDGRIALWSRGHDGSDHDEPGHDEVGATASLLPADDGVTRQTRPAAAVEPVEPASPADSGIAYFEDFESTDAMAGLAVGLYHRDDFVVTVESWPGDHVVTGPNDECSGPHESRVIDRGEPDIFNNDWAYRCVPGGDLAKAHFMTAIGDTSGYSIGSISPLLSFESVVEVRWDINITDLGFRQFPEVKLIPTGQYDPTNLPCVPDLPCDTDDYDVLGAVGASFFGGTPSIATPEFPNGYEADAFSGVLCHLETDGYCFADVVYEDDPAALDVVTRREHYLRDNGDGSLTFGMELADGSFHELTGPGSFPDGPVRVVFSDHNYTPDKSLGPLGERYTWHWDNLTVLVAPATD